MKITHTILLVAMASIEAAMIGNYLAVQERWGRHDAEVKFVLLLASAAWKLDRTLL